MSGRLVQIRGWVRDNIVSPDFVVATIVGPVVWYMAARSPDARSSGQDILLAEAGLGLAVLAVVLMALSILVAFLGEEYVLILRKTKDGVAGAMRPYRFVGSISGLATVFSLLGAMLWSLCPPALQAFALAVGTWLTVWSVLGTIQLVGLTAKHGTYRARIPEIREALREGRERRRRNTA